MTTSPLEIILSVHDVGVQPHTVTVYMGCSVKFSLQPFLHKHGLHHDDLTLYDTTRKTSVDWEDTVDDLLSSTILISDIRPRTGRRSSDTPPVSVFQQGTATSDDPAPKGKPVTRSLSLPGRRDRNTRRSVDSSPLSDIPERPPPSPPHNMDDSKLRCYHGTLAASEVEQLLRHRPAFSFLVRNSVSQPGNFTVSAKYHNNNIFHFRVNKERDKYFVTENRKFTNMVALLKHFSHHPIPGQSVQDLKLIHPIPRVKVGESEAEMGYTQFIKKDEWGAASYLATSPNQEQIESLRQKLPAQASRPPAPLPPEASEQAMSKGVYSTAVEEGKSRLPELLQNLVFQEQPARCVCGLLVHEATLIDGWMMHQSNDPVTRGQVYFAKGNDVVWDLPDKTMAELEKVNPQKAECVRKRLLSDP